MDRLEEAKGRCPAMIEAGIEDPESARGILFCTGTRDGEVKSRCPYPYCVVFPENDSKKANREKRVGVAQELRKHAVSVKDIALLLNVSANTVRGYLKE